MNIPSRFGNIIKRAQGYDFLINDHRVDVNRKWTSQSFTNPTFDRSQNFIPAGNEHAVKFRENVIKNMLYSSHPPGTSLFFPVR